MDLRDQLYTNINLLRMGCAGRMSLSLEQPTYVTLFSTAACVEIEPVTPAASPRRAAFANSTASLTLSARSRIWSSI